MPGDISLSNDGAAAGLDPVLGAGHAVDLHHDLQVVLLPPLVDPGQRVVHARSLRLKERL